MTIIAKTSLSLRGCAVRIAGAMRRPLRRRTGSREGSVDRCETLHNDDACIRTRVVGLGVQLGILGRTRRGGAVLSRELPMAHLRGCAPVRVGPWAVGEASSTGVFRLRIRRQRLVSGISFTSSRGWKRVIRRLFVLGCATLYTGGGGQWTPSQI